MAKNFCAKTDFFRHVADFKHADNFVRRKFSSWFREILSRRVRNISCRAGDKFFVPKTAACEKIRSSRHDNFVRSAFRDGYFFAVQIRRAAEHGRMASLARHQSVDGANFSA